MRSASVREAKENLEELIEAVIAGEDVEITNNGTAVAELQPVLQRPRSDSLRQRRVLDSEAILEGVSPAPNLERFPPGSVSSGVLDALLEERREGR